MQMNGTKSATSLMVERALVPARPGVTRLVSDGKSKPVGNEQGATKRETARDEE